MLLGKDLLLQITHLTFKTNKETINTRDILLKLCYEISLGWRNKSVYLDVNAIIINTLKFVNIRYVFIISQ